jgi:hypothetical protein
LALGTDFATPIPNEVTGVTLVGPGAAAGAIVGVVVGVIVGIVKWGDCCPEEVVFDCKPVSGLSLKFDACSPKAELTAWNFGKNITSLSWGNTNGVPASAVTPVSMPRLVVTQTSTLPVITKITTACSNGTNPDATFTNDLAKIASEVSPYTFSGPSQVQPNSTSPVTYFVTGVAVSDKRHSFSFKVSQKGTIISQDDTSCTIQWSLGEEEKGKVTVTAKNNCPNGASTSKIINVSTNY